MGSVDKLIKALESLKVFQTEGEETNNRYGLPLKSHSIDRWGGEVVVYAQECFMLNTSGGKSVVPDKLINVMG